MKTFTKARLAIATFILLFLIHPKTSSAQDEIDTSFNNRVNYVFGVLEKNRVPNGMLLDYAMEFTDLRHSMALFLSIVTM
jgi:hypothetical protein